MRTWQVSQAKARFGELLEACLKEGPQIVTKRGIAAVVLVPVEAWRRLQRAARPTLKELLLAEAPRAAIPVPLRGRLRRRASQGLGCARVVSGYRLRPKAVEDLEAIGDFIAAEDRARTVSFVDDLLAVLCPEAY